jgi:hypothetical protein
LAEDEKAMSIVEQIKQDALRTAAEYAASVDDQRLYRLERMTDIITALEDYFDDNGGAFLKSIGTSCSHKGGSVVLRKSGWTFVIAPRDDMSLSVNSAVVRPDPKFPLLTDELYAQIMRGIVLWAKSIDDGTAREVR